MPAGGGGFLRPPGAAAARRRPAAPLHLPRAEPRRPVRGGRAAGGRRAGGGGRAVRVKATGLRRARRGGGGGRRVPAGAGGGGGQDDAVRVRAAAVPLRRALRGGPQAADSVPRCCPSHAPPPSPSLASMECSLSSATSLLALKGSNYAGLLERHRIHSKNVEHVVDSLRNERIEVRLVKRREYNEETVRWADAVISAGGDGTMLLAASKVFDKFKPVIGVNTDPERSEGHLCLPVRYTHSFPEALQKLYRGEFRWQWRQRIRLYLEGTGINPTPVDLHEQQLSQEQHSRAHINERFQDQRSEISGPHLLPVRALNEVFIGESLSSRASYYEISVDDGPWEKQKSSGLNVCTGTGSKAWSYNINKVANQAVEEILRIAKKHGGLNLPLNAELVQKVTNDYNDSLLYSPEEPKMLFSIREPIVNRVFSSSRQRGFSSKVCVRSRCWDACMVVDGGTSFEFNDGAIASILIDTEDALCTVLLEE
ncbi:NAD kinase 2, mitochondrial isoform X3 [Struthio camelus]|uniref:NAD kinase 2, mitochondrial isoform X3 n=1 Tax=Struthio camelus TaxID=8801 RepID=UPI0036040E30